MSHHKQRSVPSDARIPGLARIAFFVFLGFGLFFLITEHTAHAFGILPFLLIAACPLLHLGGHGRHGGHGGHRDSDTSDDDQARPDSASDTEHTDSKHRH